MRRLRILLADDHDSALASVRRLLEPEFEIVGAVSNGRDLVTATKELRPDVVITDLSMPIESGLEAARRLAGDVVLIFLTSHDDPELVAEACEAGAAGYILKSRAATELATAIHETTAGRRYVSTALRKS